MSMWSLTYQQSIFKRYHGDISEIFTRKMAAEINWHRRGTKLCHCHPVLPSVLWRCWLGSRKGVRPVKTEWWGAGVVICLERGADLHMAQLMPLPLNVSCFSKIQISFTFLVPAHLGSPRKGPLNGCVFLTFWLAHHYMKTTLYYDSAYNLRCN